METLIFESIVAISPAPILSFYGAISFTHSPNLDLCGTTALRLLGRLTMSRYDRD